MISSRSKFILVVVILLREKLDLEGSRIGVEAPAKSCGT